MKGSILCPISGLQWFNRTGRCVIVLVAHGNKSSRDKLSCWTEGFRKLRNEYPALQLMNTFLKTSHVGFCKASDTLLCKLHTPLKCLRKPCRLNGLLALSPPPVVSSSVGSVCWVKPALGGVAAAGRNALNAPLTTAPTAAGTHGTKYIITSKFARDYMNPVSSTVRVLVVSHLLSVLRGDLFDLLRLKSNYLTHSTRRQLPLHKHTSRSETHFNVQFTCMIFSHLGVKFIVNASPQKH